MTELSAAAKEILDAFNCEARPEPYHQREAIAAALRAAVDQCEIEWNYHPDYPETEWVVLSSDLRAIADELEAQ